MAAERPSSASNKRRSRFLACFGAKHGSSELLDAPKSADKPQGWRSEDEPAESSSSSMLSSSDSPASHRLRLINGVGRRPSELVPDDYYIEPELPLILNAEPKTYGKRLASSSVQTEGQDNNMSILAADKSKKSRGLLRRSRKNKTQLNIRCDPVSASTRPKSVNSNLADGAETCGLAEPDPSHSIGSDKLSAIEDVVTSDDQKWRTCTIQTDSESVIVNYVIGPPAANDDGYVSGSGDLAKQQATKSSGMSTLCGLSSKHRLSLDSDELEAAQAAKKARKSKTASSKKLETSRPNSPESKGEPVSIKDASGLESEPERTSSPSSASKELKLKQKQERKQQKRQQEEAEKAQKKRVKEAKKAAKKSGKKSPDSSAADDSLTLNSASRPTSVKFAEPTSLPAEQEESAAHLDSLQQVIENTGSEYERQKEELGQADGRDMVRVSLTGTEQLEPEPQASSAHEIESPEVGCDESKVVSNEKLAEQLGSNQAELIVDQLELDQAEMSASKLPDKEDTEQAVSENLSKKELEKSRKRQLEREKREAKEQAKLAKQAAKEAKKKEKKSKELTKKSLDSSEMKEPDEKRSSVSADSSKAEEKEEEEEEKVKKNKKKKKKEKKGKEIHGDSSGSTSEPTTSSTGGFLNRLFSKRSAAEPKSESVANVQAQEKVASQELDKPQESKVVGAPPIVLSEMYPQDPDEVNGEMILEVNVPKELVEKHQQAPSMFEPEQQSLASDTPASPTTMPQSTTIDETLASQTSGDFSAQPEQGQNKQPDDDQSTLVDNATGDLDDNDEDATDNALSQVQELPVEQEVDASMVDPLTSQPEEVALIDMEKLDKPEVSEPIEPSSSPAEIETVHVVAPAAQVTLTKAELKDRKKLEKKLESEAKKRLKEDEKIREAEEKEAKKRAKDEAKKAAEQAKQAAAQAKKEAKEAKQRAKQEAKLLKREREEKEKEKKAKAKKEEKSDLKSGSLPAPSAQKSQESINNDQEEVEEAPNVADELEALDLSNMSPVSEETEVEKIVEEVVGDDGVITKTTKTIETKLVTLRQEELKTAEHRELPLDEYERELREQQQAAVPEPALDDGKQLEPELEEILAAPSCFSPECKLNLKESKLAKLSPKSELKKRLKLNEQLVKQAKKFSSKQQKSAEQQAKVASKQLAACKKELAKAQKLGQEAAKESCKALKDVAKSNKKMDKRDKKLAKRQKKIDKKEKELNKKAEKLAKKEAKRQSKLARQASSQSKASSGSLERKSSGSSKKSAQASRKSIKLEDIGEPVLRSSSRLSIGGVQAAAGSEVAQEELPASSNDNEAVEVADDSMLATSDDLQVEMSLEDVTASQPGQPIEELIEEQQQQQLKQVPIINEAPGEPELGPNAIEPVDSDKELNRVVSASDAQEAPISAEEQEEEIDVVSDLPQISKIKRKSQDDDE